MRVNFAVVGEWRMIEWGMLSSQPHGLILIRWNQSLKVVTTALTFSCLMTYIYIYIYMSYRIADLQTLHFIYLFNRYTY
jgi:hypothetical protein